jgi:hypothetical protein
MGCLVLPQRWNPSKLHTWIACEPANAAAGWAIQYGNGAFMRPYIPKRSAGYPDSLRRMRLVRRRIRLRVSEWYRRNVQMLSSSSMIHSSKSDIRRKK